MADHGGIADISKLGAFSPNLPFKEPMVAVMQRLQGGLIRDTSPPSPRVTTDLREIPCRNRLT